MRRFFKKSRNIAALSGDEVRSFIKKEKLTGKVTPDRVVDWYNALSTMSQYEKLDMEDDIDYSQFGCKTNKDINKVNQMKDKEVEFIQGIDKEFMSGERRLKTASFLANQFEEMMYGGKKKHSIDLNEKLKNMFTYDEDQDLPPMEFGELIEKNLDFMKYVALLNSKPAFAVQQGKDEKDPSGKKMKYVQMEGISEIVKADMIQFAMPHFMRKLATEDVQVRNRFRKANRSQNLIMLVDDSGSMSNGDKPDMLKAILTLKLRDYKPYNNIYIGTFEREIYGFYKIKEGDKFEDLSFIRLSKGTTEVNECIKATFKHIKEKKLPSFTGDPYPLSDDHFEIMVVNDGEDDVDASLHPVIKIHALCLQQENNALKNICHRSGGTYYYMKE